MRKSLTLSLAVSLVFSVMAGHAFAENGASNPDGTSINPKVSASNCLWVDSQNRRANTVMGYEVDACGGGSSSVLICSGRAECNLRVKQEGRRDFAPPFTWYGEAFRPADLQFVGTIENVMCYSRGTRCGNANDCVNQGGVLRDQVVGSRIRNFEPGEQKGNPTFAPKERDHQ